MGTMLAGSCTPCHHDIARCGSELYGRALQKTAMTFRSIHTSCLVSDNSFLGGNVTSMKLRVRRGRDGGQKIESKFLGNERCVVSKVNK